MITKNQECDIVSDLLPLYLENKTMKETEDFIEAHLQECESCRKNLKFMNTSYEGLFIERKERKQTKGMFWGRAMGKAFVCGFLFILICVWIYIIAIVNS